MFLTLFLALLPVARCIVHVHCLLDSPVVQAAVVPSNVSHTLKDFEKTKVGHPLTSKDFLYLAKTRNLAGSLI